jgi:hypothetical protein
MKRHQAVQSQRQFLVQWRPTIEEQWSLDAHLELGYAPQKCTPIDFADLYSKSCRQRSHEQELFSELFDRLTCELCDGHEKIA